MRGNLQEYPRQVASTDQSLATKEKVPQGPSRLKNDMRKKARGDDDLRTAQGEEAVAGKESVTDRGGPDDSAGKTRIRMAFDELASDYDALLKPKEPVEQMYKKKLPVVFGPITDKNVEQVKTLNRAIFPVKYNDKFYSDVQKSGEHTQLAYYSTGDAMRN